MKSRYRKALVLIAILFGVSVLLTGIFAFFALNDDPTKVNLPQEPRSDNLLMFAWISLLTSMGSAIAFVSTFVLSWTKEKREREMFAMDAERKKLENEKLALELEQLRKNRD